LRCQSIHRLVHPLRPVCVLFSMGSIVQGEKSEIDRTPEDPPSSQFQRTPIHAPARGGDTTRPCDKAATLFQSTPPRGGRREGPYAARLRLAVSIHAPARGATDAAGGNEALTEFQSTPPRGGRPRLVLPYRGALKFQSTPPRGGRLWDIWLSASILLVSIHAPARGATKLGYGYLPLYLFQSTPPRGGRRSHDSAAK